MLRVSMSSTNNQSLAISFLNFAVRNYISARILYLNNQLHDAGVMSHEAFEKVMKALIYFKNPSSRLGSIHQLNGLRNELFRTFGLDELRDAKDIFNYYEDCYSYRYPDKKQPKSFSTGTNKFQSLDNIFFYFHEECLKEIKDDHLQNKSGIFSECRFYFKSNNPIDLKNITFKNDSFTLDYINQSKNFWYSQGAYIINASGFYFDVDGNGYR